MAKRVANTAKCAMCDFEQSLSRPREADTFMGVCPRCSKESLWAVKKAGDLTVSPDNAKIIGR